MIFHLENGEAIIIPDNASVEETSAIVSNVEMSSKDIGALLYSLKSAGDGFRIKPPTPRDLTPENTPNLTENECTLINMYRALKPEVAQTAFKVVFYMALDE